MAEGFITRRGGVGSEQALAPTITFVSKTDSQIVFTIKNNDDATAVILWELDDATPDANSLELAADTTSNNITVTGLDDDTEFIVYATANVTGKVKSNVSQLSITTDQLPTFISATGGTTAEYNESGKRYKSHTFTSSGNFVVNSLSNQGASFNQVDYLIIAGGAAGGSNQGGGGGAGGYRTTNGTSGGNSASESKVTVTAQSYGITVGSGGASVDGTNSPGNNGNNSSALGVTSTGGGGGGAGAENFVGLTGGSGGGGGYGASGVTIAGGIGIVGQGSNGGTARFVSGQFIATGGGGGAGAVGQNHTTSKGGDGGAGLANTLRTGSAETRAGGGGGMGQVAGQGSGGSGGGGNGSFSGTPGSGTINTGSGGGGGVTVTGAGGSGLVVIRYEIAPSA